MPDESESSADDRVAPDGGQGVDARNRDGAGEQVVENRESVSAPDRRDESDHPEEATGGSTNTGTRGDEGDSLADRPGNDATSTENETAEEGAYTVPEPGEVDPDPGAGAPDVPADVRNYDRFQKMDRASYERVNEFLRDRTYITAREWAIARLCADFRTGTGVEMTKIGENLPHLVPFMTDTYSPQAVNQARSAFEEKVQMAGATFLYGAMSGFFTADDLDDLMYEVTEIAKFLLEVEGVELAVEEELESEDRISDVMREVRQASDELRHEGAHCPECGVEFDPER